MYDIIVGVQFLPQLLLFQLLSSVIRAMCVSCKAHLKPKIQPKLLLNLEVIPQLELHVRIPEGSKKVI